MDLHSKGVNVKGFRWADWTFFHFLFQALISLFIINDKIWVFVLKTSFLIFYRPQDGTVLFILPALARPAQHQLGFRKQHSTTTILQKSIMVAMDLSKAFYLMNHHKFMESSLPSYIKRWLVNYIVCQIQRRQIWTKEVTWNSI